MHHDLAKRQDESGQLGQLGQKMRSHVPPNNTKATTGMPRFKLPHVSPDEIKISERQLLWSKSIIDFFYQRAEWDIQRYVLVNNSNTVPARYHETRDVIYVKQWSMGFPTLENILPRTLSFVWNNNEANPTTKNRIQMNVSLIDFPFTLLISST